MPICYIVGVDDNGAAVVSMLEVARQLTEMNRQGLKRLNTVIFVSFDIEEEGNLLKSVLNLCHFLGKFSEDKLLIFSYFSRKWTLRFHSNCLLRK